MIIGLCGAQGSGKSTLGSEFAKRNKLFTFVPTSTTQIMRGLGMDPALGYPIEQRIEAQEAILSGLDAQYAQHANYVVFDRTPLDMIGYMLADVHRQNVPQHLQERIDKYVRRAIEVTNKRFTTLVYLPAVLDLGDAPRDGKAPHDRAYQEHISMLIKGALTDERITTRHAYIPRATVDLEERVNALDKFVGRTILNFTEHNQLLRAAGHQFH